MTKVSIAWSLSNLADAARCQRDPTRLYRILKDEAHYRDELLVAILEALEQIGDARALPAVTRLAENAEKEYVRAAAQRCRSFLVQRDEQERLSATLLRSATSPEMPAGRLLRPAQGDGETAPERLLRPG